MRCIMREPLVAIGQKGFGCDQIRGVEPSVWITSALANALVHTLAIGWVVEIGREPNRGIFKFACVSLKLAGRAMEIPVLAKQP